MKGFEEWIRTGPLAGVELTKREMDLARLAYTEAAYQSHDAARLVFERILNQPPRRAA